MKNKVQIQSGKDDLFSTSIKVSGVIHHALLTSVFALSRRFIA